MASPSHDRKDGAASSSGSPGLDNSNHDPFLDSDYADFSGDDGDSDEDSLDEHDALSSPAPEPYYPGVNMCIVGVFKCLFNYW